MAKVYILTEDDIQLLRTMIDRDPRHGSQGGSGSVISEKDTIIYSDAHRFYNFQVCEWIGKVTK